jgi:hypothetical protein
MHHFTATLKLVTPAILSGYDQGKAEIRLPSMLGMIKQWWSAQNLVAPGSELEAEIFGAAAREPGDKDARNAQKSPARGQSVFSATLSVQGSVRTQPIQEVFAEPAPERALLGSLLTSKQSKRVNGEVIPAETGVLLTFYFRAQHAAHAQSLASAVELWSLLGGIGTAQRRGFGSVCLRQLDQTADWFPPRTESDVAARLRTLLAAARKENAAIKEFPAFGVGAQIWLKNLEADPAGAFSRFAGEIDEFAQARGLLPSDVFSEQAVTSRKGSHARLPSPLHIHVQPLEGRALILMSMLPTQFDLTDQPGAIARIADFLSHIGATQIFPE